MNAFPMQLEYIDSETGEMVTESILIDDFPYRDAKPFAPEPENDSENPW